MQEPSTTEGAESEARLRDSWNAPQSSRPRALPPDFESPPRSTERGPLVRREKPQSIPSLQGTKPLRSETASATIKTMMSKPASAGNYATTSVAPPEATTLGGVGATTVRMTEAPHVSLRAHKFLAEPYAGHHSRLGFVH